MDSDTSKPPAFEKSLEKTSIHMYLCIFYILFSIRKHFYRRGGEIPSVCSATDDEEVLFESDQSCDQSERVSLLT